MEQKDPFDGRPLMLAGRGTENDAPPRSSASPTETFRDFETLSQEELADLMRHWDEIAEKGTPTAADFPTISGYSSERINKFLEEMANRPLPERRPTTTLTSTTADSGPAQEELSDLSINSKPLEPSEGDNRELDITGHPPVIDLGDGGRGCQPDPSKTPPSQTIRGPTNVDSPLLPGTTVSQASTQPTFDGSFSHLQRFERRAEASHFGSRGNNNLPPAQDSESFSNTSRLRLRPPELSSTRLRQTELSPVSSEETENLYDASPPRRVGAFVQEPDTPQLGIPLNQLPNTSFVQGHIVNPFGPLLPSRKGGEPRTLDPRTDDEAARSGIFEEGMSSGSDDRPDPSHRRKGQAPQSRLSMSNLDPGLSSDKTAHRSPSIHRHHDSEIKPPTDQERGFISSRSSNTQRSADSINTSHLSVNELRALLTTPPTVLHAKTAENSDNSSGDSGSDPGEEFPKRPTPIPRRSSSSNAKIVDWEGSTEEDYTEELFGHRSPPEPEEQSSPIHSHRSWGFSYTNTPRSDYVGGHSRGRTTMGGGDRSRSLELVMPELTTEKGSRTTKSSSSIESPPFATSLPRPYVDSEQSVPVRAVPPPTYFMPPPPREGHDRIFTPQAARLDSSVQPDHQAARVFRIDDPPQKSGDNAEEELARQELYLREQEAMRGLPETVLGTKREIELTKRREGLLERFENNRRGLPESILFWRAFAEDQKHEGEECIEIANAAIDDALAIGTNQSVTILEIKSENMALKKENQELRGAAGEKHGEGFLTSAAAQKLRDDLDLEIYVRDEKLRDMEYLNDRNLGDIQVAKDQTREALKQVEDLSRRLKESKEMEKAALVRAKQAQDDLSLAKQNSRIAFNDQGEELRNTQVLLASTRAELRALRNIGSLDGAASGHQILIGQIETLEASNQSLDQIIHTQNRDKEACDRTIKRLQEKKALLDRSQEHYKSENEQLTRKLQEHIDIIDALQGGREIQADLNALQRTIDDQKSEIQRLEAENSSFMEVAEARQVIIDRLREDVASYQANRTISSNAATDLAGNIPISIHDHLRTIEEYRSKIMRLKGELKEAQKNASAKVREENNSAKKRISKLEDQLANIGVVNEELSDELKDAKLLITTLRKERLEDQETARLATQKLENKILYISEQFQDKVRIINKQTAIINGELVKGFNVTASNWDDINLDLFWKHPPAEEVSAEIPLEDENYQVLSVAYIDLGIMRVQIGLLNLVNERALHGMQDNDGADVVKFAEDTVEDALLYIDQLAAARTNEVVDEATLLNDQIPLARASFWFALAQYYANSQDAHISFKQSKTRGLLPDFEASIVDGWLKRSGDVGPEGGAAAYGGDDGSTWEGKLALDLYEQQKQSMERKGRKEKEAKAKRREERAKRKVVREEKRKRHKEKRERNKRSVTQKRKENTGLKREGKYSSDFGYNALDGGQSKSIVRGIAAQSGNKTSEQSMQTKPTEASEKTAETQENQDNSISSQYENKSAEKYPTAVAQADTHLLLKTFEPNLRFGQVSSSSAQKHLSLATRTQRGYQNVGVKPGAYPTLLDSGQDKGTLRQLFEPVLKYSTPSAEDTTRSDKSPSPELRGLGIYGIGPVGPMDNLNRPFTLVQAEGHAPKADDEARPGIIEGDNPEVKGYIINDAGDPEPWYGDVDFDFNNSGWQEDQTSRYEFTSRPIPDPVEAKGYNTNDELKDPNSLFNREAKAARILNVGLYKDESVPTAEELMGEQGLGLDAEEYPVGSTMWLYGQRVLDDVRRRLKQAEETRRAKATQGEMLAKQREWAEKLKTETPEERQVREIRSKAQQAYVRDQEYWSKPIDPGEFVRVAEAAEQRWTKFQELWAEDSKDGVLCGTDRISEKHFDWVETYLRDQLVQERVRAGGEMNVLEDREHKWVEYNTPNVNGPQIPDALKKMGSHLEAAFQEKKDGNI